MAAEVGGRSSCSPDSTASISSEERRNRYSYASQVASSPGQPPPDTNSEDDFRLRTVEPNPSPPEFQANMNKRSSPLPQSRERLPLSPEISVLVSNHCPCELEEVCKEDCCVERLRSAHRARLEKMGGQGKLLSPLRHSPASSYGSLEDIQHLASPIASLNSSTREGEGSGDGGDERESSDEPLLNAAQRSRVGKC